MKKLVVVVSACMLMAVGSKAQGRLEAGFRFNPQFTAILNKEDADAGNELNPETHFTARSFGVGFMYNISNSIGLGADVLFSREGQAFSGYITGTSVNQEAYTAVIDKQTFLNNELVLGDYKALAELNYVKVPVMLSLGSDKSKKVFFSVLAGPQFNFLVNVAQEVNGKDLEYPYTNIEAKDLYKPVTYSGMLAIGGGLNVGPHLVLSARLRADYGFTDAEKKDVMISYLGTPSTRFYSTNRGAAHTLTGGLMIGLDIKI